MAMTGQRVFDLQRAQEFLDDLCGAYPDCAKCQRWPANKAYGRVGIGHFPEWDRDILADVVFKRCSACLKPSYPWAKSLTAERVLAWLQANPPEVGVLIDVEKMRQDLLQPESRGFKFL